MRTFHIIRLSDLRYICGFLLIMVLIGSPAKVQAEIPPMNVSFQVFYDELLPYGDWVNDPTHGYVWIPYVDAGFQPYQTNGYWVNSRFGNTWVSLYDWGWAPFHYGRWFFTDFYGWAWVPGYEWAPAWVSWRTGRGYYGWAPLWPSVGVHVSVGFPVHHWVFVPRRRFLARNIYNYCVPRQNIAVIYNQTTVINNTYVYDNRTYVAGPSRTELQRVTRSTVPVYEVSNGTRPGRAQVDNNRVQVYRPQLEPSNPRSASQVARPTRSYSAEEYTSRRSNTPVSRVGSNESDSRSRSDVQSVRRSAAIPTPTNPRAAALPSRQSETEAGVRTQSRETTARTSTTRSSVESRSATNRSTQSMDNRRSAPSVPSYREAAPAQRQRTESRLSEGRQPIPSERSVRIQSSQQNQTRTYSQGNRATSSPSRVSPQPSTGNRQVAAPSGRQSSSGVTNSRSRIESRPQSQRQVAAPASRSQERVGRSSSPAPTVRSSGSGGSSRSAVQQPSFQRRSSSSGESTNTPGNSRMRGN